MSTIDGRLRELVIALPDVTSPVVAGYVPSQNPTAVGGSI
jgi:hypothetical protein